MDNQEDDNDFAVDAEFPERTDGQPGPPDDWQRLSWFSFADIEWWYRWPSGWRRDPPPVRALGHAGGEYTFVTAAGEVRSWTSGALHGRGGMADLFGGPSRWAARHYPALDREGNPTGRAHQPSCMERLIWVCTQIGYLDQSVQYRGVGTWRGPEGEPIVHAGDRVFHAGRILAPGAVIGDAVYVIAGVREAPDHVVVGRGEYEWAAGDASLGRMVTAHLDEWHWDQEDGEARDLFQGGLWCGKLASALTWLPHMFVRAPFGSGKSSLLRYVRALLGGSAHAVLKTYSKAFIEQNYSHAAAALLLDEAESDHDPHRIRGLIELVRLLSDDGAEGGRGSTSGKARRLDVHGPVIMAATVSEEWRPQDRSRIAYLELRGLRDRRDHPPAPPEIMAAQLHRAAEMSPALRARAIARWAEFKVNLAIARAAVLAMGGQPRDADQVGHLIAGWWTMTRDGPLDPEVARLDRFRRFIVSISEEDDGEDEPTRCLQTMFGSSPEKWIGGERVTIGQVIAEAREDAGASWRRTLLPYGLMLIRQEGESWAQAWLAVANHHPGLDELLGKYPQYQGKKRRQILGDLRRTIDGVEWAVKRSETHARIGGTQTRYVLVPPVFLPSKGEETT